MAYKLVVSNRVAFDVRWTLNDNGTEREFGFKAEADRVKEPTGDVTVGDFLSKDAKVRMVAWIGEPPVVDEEGKSPPAGQQALDALYEVIGKIPGLVLARYLEAIGPKAKLGN